MNPKKKEPSTKAKKKKSAKQPVIKETIQAPHVFTSTETADLNIKLREHLDTIDTLTGDAKAAAQDFKLRITNHTNEAKMLRTKLASGQESREMEAVVSFDATKREKTYLHPLTKKEIRKEPMTAVDWQLPMFKPDPKTGAEKVADKGATDVPTKGDTKEKPKKGKEKDKVVEPNIDHGKTPLAGALNQAAALKDAPKVPGDMAFLETLDHSTLTRHFKKEARRVGWSEAQVSAIHDLLRECDTEAKMLDVLRPHIEQTPA